ncbi:MAG: TAXI family TRAP transporter solute-binding subunit [Clostridiales bacterium]
MKRCKNFVLLLVFVLLLGSLAACGNEGQSSNAAAPATQSPSDQPPAGGGEVPFPDKKVTISMGSATSGGTFYIYCGGVATVVGQNTKNIEIAIEATQGSGANLELLRNGSVDICISEASMGYDIMTSQGDYAGAAPFEGLRAVAACYANKWMAVTLDKSITDTTQLDGKNIAVSTYMSGSHLGSMKVYDALGMKDVSYTTMAYADGFTEMFESRLDACSMLTGHPSSPIIELETKTDVNYVKLTEDQINTVLTAVPAYSRDMIEAGTYKGLTEDYDTVSNWVVLYVRDDMDDNLVYHIVKAIMENNETMVNTHAVAAASIPENAVKQVMPLHRGAIKYYEEAGIKIPDNLKID